MFHSVRFRITLWYAAALAVTLTLFSLLVYHSLAKNLDENMDQLLAFRAEGVADALEAYLETERIEVGRFPAAAVKGGAFLKIAPDLVRLHTEDPRQAAVELRVMDASGTELIRSNEANAAPELPEQTMKDVLKGNAAYDTIRVADAEAGETAFRSYATPAQGMGGAIYIVQAYRSTYHTQFALKNLRIMMAALVPLIVLLTGAFGMFFARVALRPVADMARTMRQISAENLSLRLEPPQTRDEVRELADLFNAMLSRLEDSFLSERRFIQDVSHELKTPLTILKGELQVALKKARSAGEYAAILQSNLEETDKMADIVGGLLTLARFDNREVRLERSRVDLKEMLGKLVASLSGMADKAGVGVTLSSCEAPEVEADAGQLNKLFLNLLDNAMKYGAAGGAVKVEIIKEGGRLAVRITDSGPGIKPEDLPHIFKRFYRADSARSSGGFGLGLAIARSIAEAHGAELKAESLPGQGASFTVIFPSVT
ncbi:MAG TPA: heavy metal sensor histidine kinase [Elusimicrobiales bacterium]|nr:heavy metal sensor histidine kinase [Elusimicrobiales bacterium]